MADFALYLLTAFALIFVIEGMLYGVFPETMRRMMMTTLSLPPTMLRRFGLTMVFIGFALIYLIDLMGN